MGRPSFARISCRLTVAKEYVSLLHDGLAGPVNDEQREFLKIADEQIAGLAKMFDSRFRAEKIEAELLGIGRLQKS